MRKIIMLVLMLAMCISASAQTYKRQGDTFVQTTTSRTKSEPKKTKFTWKDTKGVEYPIYVNDNGSCFVLRVSKNSGKEYRKGLGEQASKEICAELGIKYTYKPKQRNQ